MNELEFLKAVALVCNLKVSGYFELKRQCVSYVSNCAIIEDGKFGDKKLVEKCGKKFFNTYVP